MRVVELDVQSIQRRLHQSVELLVEEVRDDEAQGKKNRRTDNALAQLFQMLHQAHAGQLGALGYRGLGLLDDVLGISHGELPAPAFHLCQRGMQAG